MIQRIYRDRRSVQFALALVALSLLSAFVGFMIYARHPIATPLSVSGPACPASVGARVEAGREGGTVPWESSARSAVSDLRVATISTFLDGAPIPTLLVDVSVAVDGPVDWGAMATCHEVPKVGGVFAVLNRTCCVELVKRSDLVHEGEFVVDMRRSPALDVRLVNVPSGLRQRLDVALQLAYDSFDSEAENRASCQLLDRAPIPMREDRVVVPLSVSRRGSLIVHANSRESNISYATPKISFEPVSQVVEVDLSALGEACSLADLELELHFPYVHPGGDFHVLLKDKHGNNITHKKIARSDSSGWRGKFVDLPREVVTPVISFPRGASPDIHLEPVDLTVGDRAVVRDVVAESAVRIALHGCGDVAPGGLSVIVKNDRGEIVVAAWPTGVECSVMNLPAMTAYIQAVAYDAQACSSIVSLSIGEANVHHIALTLTAAGRVVVAPGAFGARATYLDVAYSDVDVGRVFLNRKDVTTYWLPLGSPTVRWGDGPSSVLQVAPGVANSWSSNGLR